MLMHNAPAARPSAPNSLVFNLSPSHAKTGWDSPLTTPLIEMMIAACVSVSDSRSFSAATSETRNIG